MERMRFVRNQVTPHDDREARASGDRRTFPLPSRENRRKSWAPKRAEDERHITNFGPRLYCQFLVGAERLEEKENPEKYRNNDRPDH